MLCVVCKSEMIIRSGKFGEFLCCPKSNPTDNHGTISKSKKASPKASYKFSDREYVKPPEDSLSSMIEKQMMYMGGGILTDLDRFVEGGQEEAEDDDSHWMNTREY